MTSWPLSSRTILNSAVFAIVSAIILNNGVLASDLAPAASTSPSDLALLKPWPGPQGGVPPFDKVQAAHFKPALEASMETYRREIEAIADQKEPPSFENTIAAMESAGRTYSQVRTVYGVWSSTMSAPEFQAIEREMEPRLAAFSDEITQNEKLFRRIEAVYESPEKEKLTAEQQRLVWLYYTNFVRAGAKLDAKEKARATEINQRLAALFTTFSQNLLADEQELGTVLESKDDLSGLPDSVRSAAAAEAESRDLKGKWVIANTRSSAEPFLTYSDRRDLREKVWRRFVSRGDHPGERDNKPVITEVLKLRAERAKLLGYPTHAHWRLENSMARNPDRAMELMEAVWPAAIARVAEEVADMQKIADTQSAKIKIEPWDYRYYAEKVRKARYDLDENEIKPYLQLEKLVEGMFWMARELYGLNFAPFKNVPVYHPDVRVWEVKQENGQHVGMFYFDPYARPGKRSGAWMSSYRAQERFDGEKTPLVSNNSNFMKAQPGETVLISWIDAQTLFHEFGHALHGLASDVKYPSLSGTRVARDYVELPSQLKERWLPTRELLNRFALHHQTGEPMPAALVERIQKATTFNQGFATTEYLASGLLDMALHLAGDRSIDPAEFEREELARLGMPSEIVMRHRLPQFAHIFASDSYSAGYYSYLWADTLTADSAEAFLEGGGLYNRNVAERFRTHVLSTGNTIEPADAYRNFRGRDAGIEALMRYRGFPVPSKR
jgi:peptidyl-dipeptidase Dcp